MATWGESARVFVSEQRGHARELTRTAVAAGARLVVAWGGDGTVNEVASILVDTDTPLAIVPSGSGNGLARELRIDPRPEWAIISALTAIPRRIDVGELGGRVFVSIAGIGFDAHVAHCFDRGRIHRGFSAYLRVTVTELLSYRSLDYRIDRAPDRRHALLVSFANSAQFGNGARIAPAARMDDGLLDMVVVEEQSRLATICGLPRLFTGGVNRLRGVSTKRIERAIVEADEPMRFHVDGEPVQGGNVLEARVRPGALEVCAGPDPHVRARSRERRE